MTFEVIFRRKLAKTDGFPRERRENFKSITFTGSATGFSLPKSISSKSASAVFSGFFTFSRFFTVQPRFKGDFGIRGDFGLGGVFGFHGSTAV